MEFFRQIDAPECSPEWLQQQVRIASLPRFCAEIERVLEDAGEEGRIWCLWGEFPVRREVIRGGVRFSLPTCPNAFVWTLTTGLPPQPQHIVLHATINRQQHDADFIESIHLFLDAWQEGLQQAGRCCG